MDDLIYFLLLIGWLAFSFYQQSVKKKKKLEQLKADQERERREEEDSSYGETQPSARQEIPELTNEKKPDFKSVLQEILLGEQISLEQTPENESQYIETNPASGTSGEQDNQKKNIYQKYYEQQIEEKLDNTDVNTIDEDEESEQMLVLNNDEYEQTSDEGTAKSFNLREAIIYSEILNRRYTN